MDYLEDELEKKELAGRGENRKALDDEIDKKRCLEKDVDTMTSSADEFADKAEKPTPTNLLVYQNPIAN